ncbi:MAG: zinc ribbon domain-containing protein [Ruminococcus sp.]|nr:zinc ribbon domain-containing protein [Ruminococcus sp.]
MICRYCGKEVNENIRFCNHCGANLGAERITTGNNAANAQPQYQPQPQPFPVQPMQYEPQPYKKTHKGLIIVLALIPFIILALIIIPAIIGYSSDIRRVKNGSIDAPGYSNKKWGEVLDDLCDDSEWTQYKEDGKRMVKYTGEKKSDGNDFEIIFKLHSDRKNFDVVSIKDGDMELTNGMAISLAVIEIFDGNYK